MYLIAAFTIEFYMKNPSVETAKNDIVVRHTHTHTHVYARNPVMHVLRC